MVIVPSHSTRTRAPSSDTMESFMGHSIPGVGGRSDRQSYHSVSLLSGKKRRRKEEGEKGRGGEGERKQSVFLPFSPSPFLPLFPTPTLPRWGRRIDARSPGPRASPAAAGACSGS